MAEQILLSPKYHALGVPAETVIDLLRHEQERYADRRSLVKAVKRKLHNIMAPYLENLDYGQAVSWIKSLPHNADEDELKTCCSRIMSSHASTRERLPFLHTFYERVFKAIGGKPDVILDLACGLHPFAFPWMGLPKTCRVHAYDIHKPRVELINLFFQSIGLEPLAELRDVLVNPPRVPAQVVFLFKEAHRMEKSRPGCSRSLWSDLPARYLLISLPSVDLSGSHDLGEKHRNLVSEIVAGLPWKISEVQFPNELVFVLDKGDAYG